MDQRFQQLTAWLGTLGLHEAEITPASGDASFRRYFRVSHAGKTFIVMDAPPDKEDCVPFIKIAAAMAGLNLHVPIILEQDLEQGLLLLSDLGQEQYLSNLNDETADAMYGDAIDALVKLQSRGNLAGADLPHYDSDMLSFEMGLMQEWFFERHLHLSLSQEQQMVLDDAQAWLLQQALAQPLVWVHRDYHSRNLMLTEENNPGILDFQDAVIGPLTYDLVSLLKDCYITWPRQRVERWLVRYQGKALAAGIAGVEDYQLLLRWFDAMGLQRHIKVLGIFARLNIRDGKSGYLQDIPRVFDYIVDACQRLPQLQAFKSLLDEVVIPAMKR